ncbi:hypothetical protein H4582DRAFT_2126560 [Lactarius indigo]|nr:hypothetical protein H4582DRAFT_2126560 [Lactarius indigo]
MCRGRGRHTYSHQSASHTETQITEQTPSLIHTSRYWVPLLLSTNLKGKGGTSPRGGYNPMQGAERRGYCDDCDEGTGQENRARTNHPSYGIEGSNGPQLVKVPAALCGHKLVHPINSHERTDAPTEWKPNSDPMSVRKEARILSCTRGISIHTTHATAAQRGRKGRWYQSVGIEWRKSPPAKPTLDEHPTTTQRVGTDCL